LRRFSFGGYGLALAALALVVFGAIECPQLKSYYQRLDVKTKKKKKYAGENLVR